MIMKKYQSVLELGTQLNIQNGDVSQENGILKITSTAKISYKKILFGIKLKPLGGKTLQISKPLQKLLTILFTSIIH